MWGLPVAGATFVAASLLLIWRLEVMAARGFEGTALGALVMPWCSGLGNLLFVFILLRNAGPGEELLVNALVNNVTNLTLLLGLPSLLFHLAVVPRKRTPKKQAQEHRLNRLALLLSLAAAGFFTGILWALGRDGELDFGDGVALLALFLFWQVFSVYDVLKTNLTKRKSLSPWLLLDLLLILPAAVLIYVSVDAFVAGLLVTGDSQWLGWLTGWLMVLPNALLAFWYALRNRPDVVYSSQLGDGHICIPLAVGLYALFAPLALPALFHAGLLILGAALLYHWIFLLFLGRLPRWAGAVLVLAYGVFLWRGLG